MTPREVMQYLCGAVLVLAIITFALLNPEQPVELRTPLLSYHGTILGLVPVLLVIASVGALWQAIFTRLLRQKRR